MQLLLFVACFLPKVKLCSLKPYMLAVPSCMHVPFWVYIGTPLRLTLMVFLKPLILKKNQQITKSHERVIQHAKN